MKYQKKHKFDLKKTICGYFFAILGFFGCLAPAVLSVNPVYADPVEETTSEQVNSEEATEESTNNQESNSETEQKSTTGDNCQNSLGALGWLVCPTTGKIAEAVDWLYEKIENILVITPYSMENGTPIYEIWKYCRGITNIIFIIFLLVVIYSQITGFGISNYGIKKALPKLIVAAILVNLSFIICTIAVDVSNIVGSSLRDVFTSIEQAAISSTAAEGASASTRISYANMYSSLAGGSVLAVGAGVIAFETGAIWMLIPVVLGALVAVASGLITIALRQAVVMLLIMISPLAIVAYMLPNTDNLFKKWKSLLTKMLIFYPMFSLLFGASSLAGFAIIASAKDGFSLLLGTAVQIFPLFFSWSLMKMSGTFLGDINAKIRGLANKPVAYNRGWADSHRQLAKQKSLASGRATTPSLRLMQFVANRRVAREEDTAEAAQLAQKRGQAYRARRNWRGTGATGLPTKRGERAYERMAQGMEYQQVIERDQNNMNKGFSHLAKAGTAEKAHLEKLDAKIINSAVKLKTEQARGEKIAYDNARGIHKGMENAINAHLDVENGFVTNKDGTKTPRSDYKFHFNPNSLENSAELARYNVMHQIMDGNNADVQYAAAIAAQNFDTQQKLYNTRMQNYYTRTPASKDIYNKLNELTRANFDANIKAADNIDGIISAFRVFNQRGDMALIQKQLDNICDLRIGGGIELGTLASQELGRFFNFEVKDSDPFMRRFGKYINIETASVFNNDRKEANITYDEYLRGYHLEPSGEKRYPKKPFTKLIEGTSLDNIERESLTNFDERLKKAHGYDENDKTKTWDVSGYIKRREEIQTALEPAFLSASLKWLSGSEQINSGVRFWTGYEQRQQKDANGKTLVDDKGDPIYILAPVWEGKEFAGHEDEVKDYYLRKTRDYFKDQTAGQILNMRTDYRESTKENMFDMYLHGLGGEESEEERAKLRERQAEFKKREAEIQTRYADKSASEAEKLRKRDLSALKMEFAGRQIRMVLGESGKLKQIYRTRTSGTAINAKDWLRKWVGLDNEDQMREEVAMYEEQRKRTRTNKYGATEADDGIEVSRIYTEADKENYLNEMMNLKDKTIDDETELFFEETRDQLVEWFSEDTVIVKKYDEYYHKTNPYADNLELYNFLNELLDDLNNYPDA